jgi:hypothetical protein
MNTGTHYNTKKIRGGTTHEPKQITRKKICLDPHAPVSPVGLCTTTHQDVINANYKETTKDNATGTRATMTLNTEELPSKSETQHRSAGSVENQPEQQTLGQQTT